MNSVTLPRNGLREIAQVEGLLRTALGDDYLAMSLNPREAIIYLRDDAPDGKSTIATRVYAQYIADHNPLDPTPGEVNRTRIATATTALKAADFNALAGRVGAANSIPALRAEVAELARIVRQLALSLGLNEQEETGA